MKGIAAILKLIGLATLALIALGDGLARAQGLPPPPAAAPQPPSPFTPRPPMPIPASPQSPLTGPALQALPPSGNPAITVPVIAPSQTPVIPSIQAAPTLPAPTVAGTLALSARYGGNTSAINGGVLWRIYADKPDPSGNFRLIREDRNPSPSIALPPGSYVVHVSFGLAHTAKRVQLRAETLREIFELPAGGVRFEGKVGDARIAQAQIAFDLYKGTQFEPGEKMPIARNVATGDITLVPEGVYHVVSNYGDGNAVVRSDLRVQAGKLTDVTVSHRAASIMLKLVGDKGGEAMANTGWSVLTPGGDIIRESTGAFPRFILEEGDYVVIARNEGRVFNRPFKVEAGVDREIEVLAR